MGKRFGAENKKQANKQNKPRTMNAKSSCPTVKTSSENHLGALQQEMLDAMDPPRAVEEIDFWSDSIADDLAWFSCATAGCAVAGKGRDLAAVASALSAEWKALEQKAHTLGASLNPEGIRGTIAPGGMAASRDFSLGKALPSVFPLLTETKSLLTAWRLKSQNGEWVGFVRPFSIECLHEKITYFEDRLAGVCKGFADEIVFWNRLNGARAAECAHLFDHAPRLADLTRVFLSYQERTTRLNESNRSCCCGLVVDVRKHKSCLKSLLLLSLNVTQELDLQFRKLEKDLKERRFNTSPGLFDLRWVVRSVKDCQRAAKILQTLALPTS